jgi:pimeloyl-ACP methyl ester carboxylesterase
MAANGRLRVAARLLAGALLSAAALARAGPALEPPPGTRMHRLDDPVFGGEIAVYEAGAGNAKGILLVHGIGQGGARDYGKQIAWLKGDYHVVAPDLPGFGASDRGNELYSPSNYATVLKAIAERFFDRPFALVGHSMGAVVALRYAATYPADVERLVVMDAPGVLHPYASTSGFLAYLGRDYVPRAAGPAGELENLARRLLAPLAGLKLDPRLVLASPQLRETLLGGDPVRISGLAVVTEDLRDALPRIRMPTLLAWGARDELAPIRNARVLAAKLPLARLVTIEGAGHTPMIEAPDALRAVLAPFLEGRMPPAPPPPAREARGDAACRGERGVAYEGEYDRLTIERCSDVLIRGSRVRELRVFDSSVTIEASDIGGGATGLAARGSSVVVTGGRIDGDVAILAVASRLDLAAVSVTGRTDAVRAEPAPGATEDAPAGSIVVFSLCRVRSPHTRAQLHDVFRVVPGAPL